MNPVGFVSPVLVKTPVRPSFSAPRMDSSEVGAADAVTLSTPKTFLDEAYMDRSDIVARTLAELEKGTPIPEVVEVLRNRGEVKNNPALYYLNLMAKLEEKKYPPNPHGFAFLVHFAVANGIETASFDNEDYFSRPFHKELQAFFLGLRTETQLQALQATLDLGEDNEIFLKRLAKSDSSGHVHQRLNDVLAHRLIDTDPKRSKLVQIPTPVERPRREPLEALLAIEPYTEPGPSFSDLKKRPEIPGILKELVEGKSPVAIANALLETPAFREVQDLKTKNRRFDRRIPLLPQDTDFAALARQQFVERTRERFFTGMLETLKQPNKPEGAEKASEAQAFPFLVHFAQVTETPKAYLNETPHPEPNPRHPALHAYFFSKDEATQIWAMEETLATVPNAQPFLVSMLAEGIRQKLGLVDLRRLWDVGTPEAKAVIVEAVAQNIHDPKKVAYYIRESAKHYSHSRYDKHPKPRESFFWWQVMAQMLQNQQIPLAASWQGFVRSQPQISKCVAGTSSGHGPVAKVLALMENHYLQEVLFSLKPGVDQYLLLNQYNEARDAGYRPAKT